MAELTDTPAAPTAEQIEAWRLQIERYDNLVLRQPEAQMVLDMALRAHAVEAEDRQTGTFGLPAYLHPAPAQDKPEDVREMVRRLRQRAFYDELTPLEAANMIERLAAPGPS